MGKVKLARPFESLSGRVSGDSDFYLANRNGRIVVSNYPKHRDPKTITAHQRELNTAFSQAVKQCKIEMTNPDRLAYWQDRYAAYKKAAAQNLSRANIQFFGTPDGQPTIPADKFYLTLRGFIIAQLRKQQ